MILLRGVVLNGRMHFYLFTLTRNMSDLYPDNLVDCAVGFGVGHPRRILSWHSILNDSID